MERELHAIREAFAAHERDDARHFTDIAARLEANREMHVRNGSRLDEILAQTVRTNGRVTNLEGVSVRLDKSIALLEQSNANLAKIVSAQHGQYESFVAQQERVRDKDDAHFVHRDTFEPVRKVVFGLVSVLLTGVIVALLALVVQ